MAHATHPDMLTVDEFLVYGARVRRSELVRGRVRVYEPASPMHSSVAGILHAAVHVFVEEHELGATFTEAAGFLLPNLPDTVRAPDVSFLRAELIPPGGFGRGFGRFAPDLAAEVLSPDDPAWAMDEKLSDYFEA